MAMLTEQRITDVINGLWGVAANVCKVAVRERDGLKGAVNWADLHPAEVEYRRNRDGEEYFCVIVEEAAPDADALIAFLHKQISNEYQHLEPPITITVETEW